MEKEDTTSAVAFTVDEAVDREFDDVNEGDIVLEKIDEFASNIDFEKQSDAVTRKGSMPGSCWLRLIA